MKKETYIKPMAEKVELKLFAFCAAGSPHIGDDPGLPEDDDDSNIFKGRSGGSNIWED